MGDIMAKKDAEPAKRANQQTIDQWVSRIDETIGTQRRNIFEFGDLLLSAESELSKSAFKKVLKASGLKSDSNAYNYMRVAQCKHLRDPEIIDHLPSTLGVLIDLSGPRWEPKALKLAIKEGVLNPSAQRVKLKKWYDNKLDIGSGKKELKDLWAESDDAKVIGFIIGRKNDGLEYEHIFKEDVHYSFKKGYTFYTNENGVETNFYKISSGDNQTSLFLCKHPLPSYSEIYFSSIEKRVILLYREDERDQYLEDGMNEIFGEFESLERNLTGSLFQYERLKKMLEPKHLKIREKLSITQSEFDFMMQYYELKTNIFNKQNELENKKIN